MCKHGPYKGPKGHSSTRGAIGSRPSPDRLAELREESIALVGVVHGVSTREKAMETIGDLWSLVDALKTELTVSRGECKRLRALYNRAEGERLRLAARARVNR